MASLDHPQIFVSLDQIVNSLFEVNQWLINALLHRYFSVIGFTEFYFALLASFFIIPRKINHQNMWRGILTTFLVRHTFSN